MTEVTCVLDVRAALGESPVWSAEERRLYWANIHGCTVNRFDPVSGENEVCQLPEQVGSLVLREQGGLVVALRSGFHFLDFDTAALTPIVDPEADKPDNRFNDGTLRAGRTLLVRHHARPAGSGAAHWGAVLSGHRSELAHHGSGYRRQQRPGVQPRRPNHVLRRHPAADNLDVRFPGRRRNPQQSLRVCHHP